MSSTPVIVRFLDRFKSAATQISYDAGLSPVLPVKYLTRDHSMRGGDSASTLERRTNK
jgi:hypothetical protein